MELNFDTAFARVSELVEDFRKHESDYLSPAYSEQDVRKDFIDKFWIALGWDVNHDVQKNPNEREVKVERGVGVEGRIKKADYAFLTPNFRDVRFFVEAKKPARNIDNADNYFQTIRYGWNAQTPVSILMDFEHFRVLDCRLKPDIGTALDRAITKLRFHYTDYADPEKFAEIYYLFSREAAHAGKLEQFAAAMPKPTGRAANRRLFAEGYKPVDEEFLKELDEMREELARSFKNRNPQLNGEELTEATQRTLDRLVFMRFLEDKLIEPEPMVDKLGDGGSAWGDFVAQSERLNRIYNGIIFKPHFIDADDFVVDEKVFAPVRDRLAHTNTVYNFNYVPIHVLGSIYERFLGKVIVTTDKRAQVVDKPEVRKAGGVYYTPEYIVRYIVSETIGSLILDKTPNEIGEFRFADIACGSGSFLLGVFDELLRHHTAYYNRNKKNRAEGLRAGCVENADGTLRLSLKQKKGILTQNIYGVDLDAQAVEVAQLSLFLKLLEDETTASARAQQLEFRETMLPDLRTNIKHGNSLVGWDIGGGLFGDEEERKLFPMDFKQAFPEVMRRGGFDAVVGNPPYRMLQPHNTSKLVLEYLRKHYIAADFKIELFHLFLQRSTSILKAGGRLGYIVPSTILNNVYAEKLRKWLVEKTLIDLIAVARGKVFPDADVHTSVLIFKRKAEESSGASHGVRTTDSLDASFISLATYNIADQLWFSRLSGNVWNILINTENAPLAFRLLENYERLGDIGEINRGLVTGNKEKYFSSEKISPSHVPIITGGDVTRYYVKPTETFVLFERPKGAGGCWDREVHFAPHKIVIRQIGEEPTASMIDEPLAVTANVFTVKGGELKGERYLLGIINSKLITFFWRLMFSDFKTSFPQITIFSLSQLPIRTINFSDGADSARHDRMVSLVEAMLNAKRKLQTARSDRDRDYYEAKCASLDRQIDELVYELYELTPEEISIVEVSRQ